MSNFSKISDEIAELTFSGQHSEARRLFQKEKDRLDPKSLMRSYFHLGLSYTRTSEYELAEKAFLKNYSLWLKDRSLGEVGFYVFQGLSFFRFFFSKHESSLYFAEKALFSLLDEKTDGALPYALVYDLLSHNFFQMGFPAKGESHLKKAISWAKKGKLKSLEKEFNASMVIYQSQYSLNINESINNLKSLLKRIPETNDYTVSELVLQISKLYFLKGNYKEANSFLLSNFGAIYKNENKRKVAKLNTLLAMLMREKGQSIEALSLIKVARKNLDTKVDFNLLLPCLGLEKDILTGIGESTVQEEATLRKSLTSTDKSIPHRIQNRKEGRELFPQAEDQLGNLIDQLSLKNVDAFEASIEKEIFHLSKTFFSNRRKRKSLCFHPKNKGILICSEEGVTFVETKMSKNQISLITEISSGPKSKEDLVEKVWGYSYDPIRHDHLVYTAIKRIRLALKEYSHWLISDDEHYRWEGDVEVILTGEKKAPTMKKIEVLPTPQALEHLNFRQIQLIEGAFSEPFSAGDHSEYFGVNRMTSFRDIKELVEIGLLVKRGRGKGTKYFLQ